MERRFYRAQLKQGTKEKFAEKVNGNKSVVQEMIEKQELYTVSIFQWKQEVFLYFEFSGKEIQPSQIFKDCDRYLKEWPGGEAKKQWVPMMDIFHYQTPQSLEHWKRKSKVEKSTGRVIFLKPEMVASYIYYHYQYQEEKPGDGDKYGIIGIHENLLFFYCEEPTIREEAPYQGKLGTSNTPKNWGELMGQHFAKWEDQKNEQDQWRQTELIFHI